MVLGVFLLLFLVGLVVLLNGADMRQGQGGVQVWLLGFLVTFERLVRLLARFWRDPFLLHSKNLFSIINLSVSRMYLSDSQLNVFIIIFNK